jgi:hypothetical protein
MPQTSSRPTSPHPTRLACALRTHGVRVALFLFVAAVAGLAPIEGSAQLRYDREYPAVPYSTGRLSDPVARMVERLRTGELSLGFESGIGYLGQLLAALGISPASQVLVFSDTSLQTGLISAAAPRAIYFNDDVYVAWLQDTELIEIASMDPNLGPVFYTLAQTPAEVPEFGRETFTCLECHDSYGLSGGGVPRFLIGSGLTDGRGGTAVHGGWELTTPETPFDRRWGGWYVTGTHGSQRHMGNLIYRPGEELDREPGANRTSLNGLVQTGPYLTPHSDIVALLVLEHQVHVQNAMTRASWEARSIDPDAAAGDGPTLLEIAAPLIQTLFLSGEAPLRSSVEGTSGFSSQFVAEGPRDAGGRSLRDFDLRTRLFRYPLSYLVYSDAFDALPPDLLDAVYSQIAAVLDGEEGSGDFAHLTASDRAAILEILTQTKPAFRAWRDLARR